jgi:hypothetical protein
MEINKESILISIYRSSNKNKEIIGKYFNPSKDCFGCKIVSGLSLEKACKQINIDLEQILRELR